MPRINPVNRSSADAATGRLLDGVHKKLGIVPNLVATMANSPAVANAYLGFSQALSTGTLPARLREQLALVVGDAAGASKLTKAESLGVEVLDEDAFLRLIGEA